ncbi:MULTISPECIES: plasmid partitioning protein RepA [unclassified Mesorhizobium]|uniref:plasmid partitioning protein RepA n=1 Tax=unclassified Mesorhizobium TaxID=325217 RepID=UPI000FCCA005|nr:MULTISPECIES: plasmid partitioning protein RepA [unclassified Mesorhizobium]RUV58660.1 plasmid partitioning protein RepA [Mesorhizobium sp. M5C.F.Ca.IN.020.29.1.1]RWI18619.1 MAG: plasmid partitioning protein RepA [Mesorhizobium sp.]RWK45227.1 MAG: plasmid partitioning protein RepA [Mesorhizobium sp.]RWK47987.1 MAG: plasmid partitioning protein RepA [Mesorhizobium sp.]RWK93890.1 MAG: plasmid partitioning protein RepA [Mesorhizobium sp.]
MNVSSPVPTKIPLLFEKSILEQGDQISKKLHLLSMQRFPPHAKKNLRSFSLAEVATYLGVSQSHLKKLHLEGKGPVPETSTSGRRSYTAEQMLELRQYLDQYGRSDARMYVPHRRPGEKLQILAVVNFKGGSGKTTTAAHLAQYLSLTGHRVLAVDLDPQASLSSLHGFQPELDQTKSLYDSIRYDDQKVPLSEIIKPTNFPGLDIVPANLELQEFEYDTPLAMTDRSSNVGRAFFTRISTALTEVDDRYDVVVIDCPPQLGYLTITALTAATSVLITIHPQMLDVMSMGQFLLMLGNILEPIRAAGAEVNLEWYRYLVTRFEPTDQPQAQMVAFLHTLFGEFILKNQMLKSTAISDAGITKQTLYEVEKNAMTRSTYERAMDALEVVNGEVADLIHKAWGR